MKTKSPPTPGAGDIGLAARPADVSAVLSWGTAVPATPHRTRHLAKAVEAESCCDEDAQDGKAAKPSQCPATATMG